MRFLVFALISTLASAFTPSLFHVPATSSAGLSGACCRAPANPVFLSGLSMQSRGSSREGYGGSRNERGMYSQEGNERAAGRREGRREGGEGSWRGGRSVYSEPGFSASSRGGGGGGYRGAASNTRGAASSGAGRREGGGAGRAQGKPGVYSGPGFRVVRCFPGMPRREADRYAPFSLPPIVCYSSLTIPISFSTNHWTPEGGFVSVWRLVSHQLKPGKPPSCGNPPIVARMVALGWIPLPPTLTERPNRPISDLSFTLTDPRIRTVCPGESQA